MDTPEAIARSSGTGSIHALSGSGVPRAESAVTAGLMSIGRARRWLAPFMSKQTFVAILYSHERRAARPSNRS